MCDAPVARMRLCSDKELERDEEEDEGYFPALETSGGGVNISRTLPM